ncbi:uncharacterized protein BXZ73DRAFT_79855 [Epithele typhae]|uniref:uncharacterized protein n=1 Tax=Epithele typhae TaxID=378194 RepID=UPI002007C914|nr:uncharacterized protein BXZ73DRAFT_79855 [Epithele typhae]KAH9921714.1 hypothetical protein BXZ73DRAFT_79855 [Epithele typhae]
MARSWYVDEDLRLVLHSPEQQLASDLDCLHLSDEDSDGSTTPKADHTALPPPSTPEPLPRVDCLPHPPHTNPRRLWVYGYLVRDNVRKRLVAEMPTLGRISQATFFELYPIIARKLLGVDEKTAKEVRLVSCQIHGTATKKIPELYGLDLTKGTHMPELVLSLFTFTNRAFRTLPSQAAVDEVTDMMGSPPVWWPVYEWDPFYDS